MLAGNIAAAAEAFPDRSNEDHLKIAASGYNCGMTRAIADARAGDSDAHTTGGDYGQDVMGRKALFDQLIATGV